MQWLPQTKPISATHSPMATGAHLAPKAALSLTQIISKEGKYDYITSASTKKKHMEDHARMWNRTKKANVTSQEKFQVFRRQRGGRLQGQTVGSWSPHVLSPMTQHRCDTGSLGTEQHPLHGERLKNHLAQSGEVKVGYFVIGSKGMYKQEFFGHHEWLQLD